MSYINKDRPIIRTVAITNEDLKSYIKEVHKKKNPKFSLNDFINSNRLSKIPKIQLETGEMISDNAEQERLVADLSNLSIGKARSRQLFDLKGANFTGAIFNNTKFIHCDLEEACFYNTHLEHTRFTDSVLNSVDFRKADLSSCCFSETYLASEWDDKIQSIRLSSSESCIRIFVDIKNKIAKKNERERLLHNKKLELDQARSNTPFLSRVGLFFNLLEGHHEYKRLRSEYKKMQKDILYRENVIHTSFQNIFRSDNCIFEPIVSENEDIFDDKIEKILVRLTRKNLIDFVNKSQKRGTKSLGKYARKLYQKSLPEGQKINKNSIIIADLSSKVNIFGNNEWQRLNISGLHFVGLDLSGANFSGSNLKKSFFSDCNISDANFDCTIMNSSRFDNSLALGVNFHKANLNDTRFINSDLSKSDFSWSSVKKSLFENSNLDYIKASNTNWRRANFDQSSLNKAIFTNSDLGMVQMSKVKAKHSLFNGSNLSQENFDDCNISYSLFNLTKMLHTRWYHTIAHSSEIRYSNMTGCKISEKCNFRNANFSHSILDGVKAPRGNFSGVQMNYTKIGYGKFAEGNFNKASMRFVEINSCLFSEAVCKEVDFTGAKIFNICMTRANLQKSIWRGVELLDSNLSSANCSDSDWQNFFVKDTLLERVNNRRIKINDNTEIINCGFRDLSGQFYHYDEDDFMDIMFIEQLSANMKKIHNALRVKKWGSFAFILKLFKTEYRISPKEVSKLYNHRMRNRKKLKTHMKKLHASGDHGVDIKQFKAQMKQA